MLRDAAVKPPSESDPGSIYFGGIGNFDGDDAAGLSIITELVQRHPSTELMAWNPIPTTGPAFVYSITPGVDVVGQSWQFIIVLDGHYLEVSMFSEASLGAVANAIAGIGG